MSWGSLWISVLVWVVEPLILLKKIMESVCWACSEGVLQFAVVVETVIVLAPIVVQSHHEMFQQGYAHQLARLVDAFGELAVLLAWMHRTGGVVVGYGDGCGF